MLLPAISRLLADRCRRHAALHYRDDGNNNAGNIGETIGLTMMPGIALSNARLTIYRHDGRSRFRFMPARLQSSARRRAPRRHFSAEAMC